MNKIANSCIWGATMQAVLDELGCLPIGPNWTNFGFFIKIFLYKIEIRTEPWWLSGLER